MATGNEDYAPHGDVNKGPGVSGDKESTRPAYDNYGRGDENKDLYKQGDDCK